MVHADLINFNAQMENVLRCVMYVIKMTIVETIQMNNRIANVSTKDDLLSRMILFILMMYTFQDIKLSIMSWRMDHVILEDPKNSLAIQSLGCLYFPQWY